MRNLQPPQFPRPRTPAVFPSPERPSSLSTRRITLSMLPDVEMSLPAVALAGTLAIAASLIVFVVEVAYVIREGDVRWRSFRA